MHAYLDIQRLQQSLAPMTMRELAELAQASGVPFTTLYKIKLGETLDPKLSTLTKLLPHLPALQATAA